MSYEQDKCSKLFVGNLSSRTQKEDLHKHFSQVGKISEIVIKDKGTSTFGFVEFDDVRDAEEALQKLNMSELKGNQIRIQFGNGGYKKREREGHDDNGYSKRPYDDKYSNNRNRDYRDRGHDRYDRDSRGGNRDRGEDRGYKGRSNGDRGDQKNGDERRKYTGCFNCGSFNHKIRDCDQKKNSQSPQRYNNRRFQRSRSRSGGKRRFSPRNDRYRNQRRYSPDRRNQGDSRRRRSTSRRKSVSSERKRNFNKRRMSSSQSYTRSKSRSFSRGKKQRKNNRSSSYSNSNSRVNHEN